MSLPRTIELSMSSLVANVSSNQSNQMLKGYNGLNASIIGDKELYHFYKVITFV